VAETTAILKVSFAPDKEISGAVPFPFKTEVELDEFENSLTPELIGFYVSIEQGRLVIAFLSFFYLYFQTKKISKLIRSEPQSKRLKLVIAEVITTIWKGPTGKSSSDPV